MRTSKHHCPTGLGSCTPVYDPDRDGDSPGGRDSLPGPRPALRPWGRGSTRRIEPTPAAGRHGRRAVARSGHRAPSVGPDGVAVGPMPRTPARPRRESSAVDRGRHGTASGGIGARRADPIDVVRSRAGHSRAFQSKRISVSWPTAGGVNGSKPSPRKQSQTQRRRFQRHVEPERRLGRAAVGGQGADRDGHPRQPHLLSECEPSALAPEDLVEDPSEVAASGSDRERPLVEATDGHRGDRRRQDPRVPGHGLSAQLPAKDEVTRVHGARCVHDDDGPIPQRRSQRRADIETLSRPTSAPAGWRPAREARSGR